MCSCPQHNFLCVDRRNIQQCSLEEYLVHKEKVDKEEAEKEEEVVESDVDVYVEEEVEVVDVPKEGNEVSGE